MKITRIETIRLADTPFVIYVRVHTDEGLVGTGDTFMMAEGIEGYIHGRAAAKVLGRDPGHIPFHIEGTASKVLLERLVLRGVFYRLLTTSNPIGRKAKPRFLSRGGPLIRIKPKEIAAADALTIVA